ncbi:hypothetical protein BAE44_0003379, partial [Dichanthelium oligosanthes]
LGGSPFICNKLIRDPPPPPPAAVLAPRASLVCTGWRRLLTDPYVLRRFRAAAHHWKPLGVFLSFSFISDPRGSIPPERFSVPVRCEGAAGDGGTWAFQSCCHGRVLLISRSRDCCGTPSQASTTTDFYRP